MAELSDPSGMYDEQLRSYKCLLEEAMSLLNAESDVSPSISERLNIIELCLDRIKRFLQSIDQ